MHNVSNKISRRDFFLPLVASGVVLGTFNPFGKSVFGSGIQKTSRRYHACISSQIWEEHPELISIVQNAGVTDIWLVAFLYGQWSRTPAELKKMSRYLEKEGFNVHIVNVPLGHPGDALGIDTLLPISTLPPKHWKNACTYDGKFYSGTSIHHPAVSENTDAIKLLNEEGFDSVFLDDDFRVARSPGDIGGCFCNSCRDEFLEKYNYDSADWDELIESVRNRYPSKILRTWIEDICDKEYDMFRALQNAAPEMDIGIMTMYLGSEKAGISLERYGDVPFRVGEFMFDDKSFGNIKGKTDELFSVLFHRRFVTPELAYSETTAFPADALSAKNMAAKLTISLIADVRNTMFMSGLKPFPSAHWKILGPAMSKSTRYHEELAGHEPKGPLKHFWGWDSRLVGRDKPFSLFLASGIPFEVTEDLGSEGYIFLSNEDAQSVVDGRTIAEGRNLVIRNETKITGSNFIRMDENMSDLFAFKNQIASELRDIPYVAGDIPAVFAWYPTARKALLWNVKEQKQTFQIIRNGETLHSVDVDGLDVTLISGL